MNSFDAKYLQLLRAVRQAPLKPTRAGVDAHMLPGASVTHDLSEGFPLSTLRSIPFSLVASELEFNLRGFSDKQWLQDRGNHIWDPWCNPSRVPYASDEETKGHMREERDLGPLYGFQWRHFGAPYEGPTVDYSGKGLDQIAHLLETLKEDPNSKRMVVTSWNPAQTHEQAIPPCPFAFEVNVHQGKLHLAFFQRSVDIMLGFPFDFACYALLLELLAKETGYVAGTVTGFFANIELYVAHERQADTLLERAPASLPHIVTKTFSSLFDWKYTDTMVARYEPAPSMKVPVVV